MIVVKKVSIELMINLLLKFRGSGEYVNLYVQPNANAIQIQSYESTKTSSDDDIENNLNQLLG